MFKGDAGRAGEVHDGPDGGPTIRWRYEAGAPVPGNVSIVGDLVYASSDDGVLHALDVASGEARWRYAPGSLVSAPTILDGSVYVFVDGNDLVALEASTGSVLWSMPDIAGGPANPTAGDGALFIPTDDGSIVALDAATGAERWRTAVSETSGAAHRPAFADGRVFVASDGGGYVALEASDGAIAWRFDTGLFETATAVVADGIAYVGAGGSATDGRLWAIDAATGKELWRVEEPYHSPSVAGGVAYSGSAGIGVAAHDTTSGERLWTFAIEGAARPLALAEGVVYVPADDERRVYALDAATGSELWHLDLDAGTDCCLSVARGAVYVGTRAGSVYAIGGEGDEPTAVVESARPDIALPPDPFTLVDTLDASVTGLSGAAALAFGPDGNLYVAQTSPPRVTVLSTSGEPIRSWGEPGAGPGQLDFDDRLPAIAVAPDGLVYVTEAGNSRLSVFEPDGTFVRHVGSFGDEPGRFLLPFDVVVDDAGAVYVTDDVLQAFSKFDASGAFQWRSDEFGDPDFAGYFHQGDIDANGRLWLAEDGGGLLVAVAEDGQKVDAWTTSRRDARRRGSPSRARSHSMRSATPT